MKYPVLVLKTAKPVDGYWDGGPKSEFEFSPSGMISAFVPLGTIKWGSMSANFWFTCGAGRTWNNAITYAKRRLQALVLPNVPFSVSVEWRGS